MTRTTTSRPRMAATYAPGTVRARRWHGEAFLERVRTVYGSEPRIRRLDTMIVVDNLGGQVTEPAPG